MIKKIFISSFVFFLSFQGLFANGCIIKDGTSKELEKYLKTNRKIISNITKEISKNKIDENKRYDVKEKIIKTYNEIIDFNGYYSYLNYYVLFPLSNDINYEVKRDYRLLENEGELINKYLESIINNGYDNITIVNACDGIEKEINCNLSGNIIDIVGILIKNHSNIINNYRTAVTSGGSFYENDYKKINFVNSDFNLNLAINYGDNNGCGSQSGSFLTKIKDEIKKIELVNEQGKNAWQDMKKSWALLDGNTDNSNLEEELLSKELDRQGISGSKADAMLNNLNEFNKTGTGFTGIIKNNFLVNSSKYFLNSIKDQTNNFYTDVLKDFVKDTESIYNVGKYTYEGISSTIDKIKNGEKNNNTISISNIINNDLRNNIDIEIATSISEIYNKEIPFIAIGNSQSTQIRSNLINLHNKLNVSIKTLYYTCESARTVCKMQDYLLGDCGSCN